mgnify:FL=1
MILEAIVIYLAAINVITFIMFGADKARAAKGRWRISESALILAALLGGSIGALAGMRIFHHKTRHRKFTVGIPVILALQIILMVIYYPYIPAPL